MKNRAKTAHSLALAIVGGIAAGMRCDASVKVESSPHFTPRPAAYTVKTYTEGSNPFDAIIPLPHKFVVITSSDGTRINVDPWPSGGRRLFP